MAPTSNQKIDAGSAAELRAWMARWDEVDLVTTAENRDLTAEEKLTQLESLRRSATLFEWPASMELEDSRVRLLWMRLHGLWRC